MSSTENVLPSAVAPELLLLPSADIFSTRAIRLRNLAAGHSVRDWLLWLASVCEAQHHEFKQLLDHDLARENASIRKAGLPASCDPHHPALLQPTLQAQLQAWAQDVYPRLRARAHATLPSSDKATLSISSQALEASAVQERMQKIGQAIADHAPLPGRDLEDLWLAASMQVAWTACAHTTRWSSLSDVAGVTHCPCCGSAPVGSIVLAGQGRAGLRYLECSLCATRWNAVRARCTLCDSTTPVEYLSLEGSAPGMQAEVCHSCHGYIKTCFQDKDMHINPSADDLATLALDVLVGEQGYGRAGSNFFFLNSEFEPWSNG